MKNSGIEWIGEIPDDWRTIKVKYVLTANDGGIWGNDPLNLESDKIVLRSTEQTVDGLWNITNPATRDLSHLSYSRFIIKSGDLLMTKSSGSKAHIGKTTLAGAFFDRHECYYSNFIQRLRLNNQSSPKYFWYIFNSIFTREQFVYLQNSTSGIGNINSDNIRSIVIPFITLQDQQKIADYLDKKCAAADRLIENQRAQIEKLKEYKQSVITEAVTRGLDPSAPMKDSGIEWIGDIAESRKIVRLKFLLSQNMAYGANESGDKNFTDSVRYIRITDITADGKLKNDEDNQYLLKEKAKEYILADKDILFARSGGTVGKTFLFRNVYGECAYAGYLIQAKCNPIKLLPEYLMYYTQSSLYSLWKNMIFIQATIQNIGANKYSNLEIVVMDFEEQKMIVSYLDKKCAEIDKLISIKQQKIETLTEYKKSLIYEYVTGKKQVG